MGMDAGAARTHLAGLDGVTAKAAWGETSYFYNPGNLFARGTYFATIKEKDGENDRASALNREGVWRLSMGVRTETFDTLFGPRPSRPAKGGVVDGPWDFERLDALTPHPVYGWMGWIAVLNPSADTFERCRPLIADAHARAVAAFDKRAAARR